METSITKICWNITNKCNDKCSFCFRDMIRKPLSVSENKNIIYNLAKSGVKSITFSGGEALLHKGIIDVIKFSHSLGLETTLVTNCLLIDKNMLSDLEKYINWITFSLDSVNENIQTKIGRNENHVDNVIKAIECIKSEKFNFNIKINTLLSNINISHINEIYDFVNSNALIKRWKVLQFTPLRGNSIKNERIYNVSDIQYKILIKNIDVSSARENLKISFDSSHSIQNLYIVISPNGYVTGWDAINNRECILGDLKIHPITKIINNSNFNSELYNFRLSKNLQTTIL